MTIKIKKCKVTKHYYIEYYDKYNHKWIIISYITFKKKSEALKYLDQITHKLGQS